MAFEESYTDGTRVKACQDIQHFMYIVSHSKCTSLIMPISSFPFPNYIYFLATLENAK